MSYCDMLDLTILGVFDQYYLLWDSFWLLVESQWILWFILRYFMVARWEPMDIVIYHWYGYYYLFWDTLWLLVESWWILWLSLMASVVDRELLWSLWLSLEAFQLLMEKLIWLFWIIFYFFPITCIVLGQKIAWKILHTISKFWIKSSPIHANVPCYTCEVLKGV